MAGRTAFESAENLAVGLVGLSVAPSAARMDDSMVDSTGDSTAELRDSEMAGWLVVLLAGYSAAKTVDGMVD